MIPCKHFRQIHQQVATRCQGKGSLLRSAIRGSCWQPRQTVVQWCSTGEKYPTCKVKNMCKAAEINGHKTNHSLRATATTEMFRSGAPEKLIQEWTGHRSLEALRCYERLDEAQHRAVCSVLSSTPQKRSISYSEHMKFRETRTFNIPPTSGYAPLMPSINLQADMFGCTINFNCAPSAPMSYPPTQQPTTMHAESETELQRELNINDM